MEYDILVEDYIESLYLTDDFKYLDEGLKDFVSNLTPPKIKQLLSKIHSPAVSKDVPKFLAVVKQYGLDYKKVKPKQALDSFKELPQDIQQGAELCARVLRNTMPEISKTTTLIASYFVAIFTKIKHSKSANYMSNIKTELKDFVSKVQQFYDEVDEKNTGASASDMKEVAMGMSVVVLLATITAVSIYTIISLIPMLFWTGVVLIGAIAAAGLMWLLIKIMN